MFLLQALEDNKTLKFPRESHEVKHFRSFSDYYREMGVTV